MQKFEIGDRVRVRDDVDTGEWVRDFVLGVVEERLVGTVTSWPGDYPLVEWPVMATLWFHTTRLLAAHLERVSECLTA